MSTPNPSTTDWVPLWATSPGAAGNRINYLGGYVAGTYNQGDIVVWSDGVAYLCVKDGTTTPPEVWPGPAPPSGGTGIPLPVVNGKWIKGEGGVPVWRDLPLGLVGSPMPWLTSAIPSGYREFDGSAIVQATHPQLYAIFGSTIPDLRGRFLLGVSGTYADGSTGGATTHRHVFQFALADNNYAAVGPNAALGSAGPNGVGAYRYSDGQFAGAGGLSPGLANWTVPTPAGTTVVTGNRFNTIGDTDVASSLPPYRAVRWITVAA